jgi:hypothetical protein
MPPFATANYETGTNGANLALADTGDATAFDLMGVVSPNTLTYDSANPLTVGTKAAKHIVSAGTSNCYWSWIASFGTQTQFYVRAYFMLGATPTGIHQLIWGLSGATTAWRIDVTNTNKIRLLAGTVAQTTSATTITNNQPFRIEAFVDHTNNAVTCHLFVGANVEGTTPDETFSFTGVALGAVSSDRIRIGTGASTALTFWSDGVAAATDTWIGPLGGVTNIAKTGGSVSAGVAGGTKALVTLQFQRPNSDLATTGWTPTPGTPTTLWDKVDEVTASDTDYISATAS